MIVVRTLAFTLRIRKPISFSLRKTATLPAAADMAVFRFDADGFC